MGRRQFVAGCGLLALGACARFHYVGSDLDQGAIIVKRSDIADRDGVLVEHTSLAFPLFLARADNDTFTAVLTRCMHRGCTVEPVGGHLVCPCHGSEYTNSGAVLKGPTEQPLIAFPVRVEGERILILDTQQAPR
jgi:cytochrome b6-f complex iron-sulfur subunit